MVDYSVLQEKFKLYASTSTTYVVLCFTGVCFSCQDYCKFQRRLCREPHHRKFPVHQLQAEALQPVRQRAARQHSWSIICRPIANPMPEIWWRPEPVSLGLCQPSKVWQQLLQELVGFQRPIELRRSSSDKEYSITGIGEAIRGEQRAFLPAIRRVHD